VIAFFFSTRRSVITRTASSSVTVRCPVMVRPQNKVRVDSPAKISYIILNDVQNLRATGFVVIQRRARSFGCS
jgi:hypothetical protein